MSPEIKVLVLDDDADLIDIICMSIDADPRLKVVCRTIDASRIEEQVRELQPEVVVVDERLEDISGCEVIEILRRSGVGPRCILYSATEDDELTEKAFAAGAKAVITKGSRLSELIGAIVEAAAP